MLEFWCLVVVVAINVGTFTCNIMEAAAFAAAILLFFLFNVIRISENRILRVLWILPIIACYIPFYIFSKLITRWSIQILKSILFYYIIHIQQIIYKLSTAMRNIWIHIRTRLAKSSFPKVFPIFPFPFSNRKLINKICSKSSYLSLYKLTYKSVSIFHF